MPVVVIIGADPGKTRIETDGRHDVAAQILQGKQDHDGPVKHLGQGSVTVLRVGQSHVEMSFYVFILLRWSMPRSNAQRRYEVNPCAL